MSRTQPPATGDYCPQCCDHEHGPYDRQGRCVQCFDHEHTSARPSSMGCLMVALVTVVITLKGRRRG